MNPILSVMNTKYNLCLLKGLTFEANTYEWLGDTRGGEPDIKTNETEQPIIEHFGSWYRKTGKKQEKTILSNVTGAIMKMHAPDSAFVYIYHQEGEDKHTIMPILYNPHELISLEDNTLEGLLYQITQTQEILFTEHKKSPELILAEHLLIKNTKVGDNGKLAQTNWYNPVTNFLPDIKPGHWTLKEQ